MFGIAVIIASFVLALFKENAVLLFGAVIGFGIIIWFIPFPKNSGF